MKQTILIVDDEIDIVEFVDYNLRKEMFRTLRAHDGMQALNQARRYHPDLVLLDLMLPGIDGLETCRRLKADPETARIPVIMLTAKGEEADVVTGLGIGADDYVPKPFSIRTLVARIKAVLRRGAADGEDMEARIIRYEDLVVDGERHVVELGGETLALTLTEHKILRFLVGHPGRAFTRAQILDNIQDEAALVTDRAVDVHIAALRKKLGRAGRWIQTVRGVGYRFRERSTPGT